MASRHQKHEDEDDDDKYISKLVGSRFFLPPSFSSFVLFIKLRFAHITFSLHILVKKTDAELYRAKIYLLALSSKHIRVF